MSVSIFTVDPTASVPSVVTSSVVGISATSNSSAATSTAATVSETPSIVTEPLGVMHSINALGARTATRCSSSPLSIRVTGHTASTCP